MRLTQFVVLGLSLAACRGDDDGTPGPGPGDDDPQIDAPASGGGSVKVKDVQSDNMPAGTKVSLKGVVVTANDMFGFRTDDLYVQDLEGGAFSGVKVYKAPFATRLPLQPGDVIDITNAEKAEFLLRDADMTLTELVGASGGDMVIVKTGTAPVPAPVAVDALEISRLPTEEARLAEWEKYEGVLVTVLNGRQTGDTKGFGDKELDQFSFKLSGGVNVQSSLVGLPTTSVFGVCYAKATGIVDSAFDYVVLPRSAADLELGGTTCAPMPTSVAGVQTSANPEVASLTNVFVTGRDDIGDSKGYWISDSLQAAPNSGVLVFTFEEAPPANFQVGATVSVRGPVTEFDVSPRAGNTLTEISTTDGVFVAAPTTPPLAVQVAANIASDIGAPGEAYEGVLVKLSNLKVTNVNVGGLVELSDTANNKLLMAKDAFAWGAQTLDTCYGTVTGVMSVDLTTDVRTINPRSQADLDLTGGDCTSAIRKR